MNISDYGIMYTFEDWNQLIDWMMNKVFDRCIVDGKDKLQVKRFLTIDDCIHYLYRLRAISDDFNEHCVAHFLVHEGINYRNRDTTIPVINRLMGKINTAIELMYSGLTMKLKDLINKNEPDIKIMEDLPTLDDIIL